MPEPGTRRTGRATVMAFNGAYHGGFLSFAGGGSPINAPFPYVMADYNDAEGVRRLVASTRRASPPSSSSR